MDMSPRIHAQEIAVLAAETVKWDIFLRAHLDIMNDRFDRVSDGSYAWVGRRTYIKELENLGINVPDLLIGTGLRSSNVSNNHYNSYASRLGRTISESKDRIAFETQLIDMINDENLDDYNRLLMFYIYRVYVQELEDYEKSWKNEKVDKIKMGLPNYLNAQIKTK